MRLCILETGFKNREDDVEFHETPGATLGLNLHDNGILRINIPIH